ncbi:MAG: hypothetical protein K6G38_05660 [Gammaproteobacteria bacterium]|nr:hypothetical protein [Gammaproteobacteria bacterium]
MGYIITIIIATIVSGTLGYFLFPLLGYSWYWCFMSIGMTLALFLMDALVAWLLRRLPEKWFDHNNHYFDERRYEKKLYNFLNVKKWKDKVPELGGFTDFHKDKIYEPNSIEFYERFILESNYGSMIHMVSAILSFFVFFMAPLKISYIMAIPESIVNFILCILPYFVLRYNVGKLKKVHLRLVKKSNLNNK